jgi:cardiolipin synthase (CMP-forming)
MEDAGKAIGRLGIGWPTRITLLRILLIAPFVVFMLGINDPELGPGGRDRLRYAAAAVYLLMVVSDGLDGFWARRSGRITRLGTLLDPIADKLLAAATCLLLISQPGRVEGFVPPVAVVAAIIAKDVLLIVGFGVMYRLTGHLHVVPTSAGKLATFLQLLMGAAVLAAPELSGLFPSYGRFLCLLWWSAGCTAVAAVVVYIRAGARYIDACERTVAKGAEFIAG